MSVMYVPLRSNAKAMVTGQPIAILRRRLKYASVFHDMLILGPCHILYADATFIIFCDYDVIDERSTRL
jgi:hypothetical protein